MNAQMDLFGDLGEVKNVVPPVGVAGSWKPLESIVLNEALRRGELVEALRVLKNLKPESLRQVLMAAGFNPPEKGLDRRTMLMAIHQDLVLAARDRITGYELHLSRHDGITSLYDGGNHVDERNNHDGRTVQTEDVSERSGGSNRVDGVVGVFDSEQVDVGLAGAGNDAAEGGAIPGAVEEAGGVGEGYFGERGGDESSVAVGNSANERGEGVAADGIGNDLDVSDSAGIGIGVTDYVLTDEDRIGLGGLAQKFDDNLQAIRLVKVLAGEKRHAVEDEKRVLARYVGWGGLKGVFDPGNKQWARQHRALKGLLTEEEWAAARRSQLDAFYTSPIVGRAMYGAVERLGFGGGRVLEPSVGVGNFFGLMPENMRQQSELHGVELDVLTSDIAAALYPGANIAKATGFQDFKIPAGYFDVVMGNPPFGSQAITDDSGMPYSGWSIHNYFFAKSIDMLRPDGLLSMVVSHNFLDKIDPHVRQWIARRAELVSGVRLPETAFKQNANTEVVTDILIFRRIDEKSLGVRKTADWLNTSLVELEGEKTGELVKLSINDYFLKNPQNVLGTHSATGSLYRGNNYSVLPTGNLENQLAEWVRSLPAGIYVPLVRSSAELDAADVCVPEGIKEGSFFLESEIVFSRLPDQFGKRRVERWVAPNQRAEERMIGMIQIRDALRHQMRIEKTVGVSDDEIEASRRDLNSLYDDFRKKNGYLNDQTNRRLFLDDTESSLLQALEFDYEKAVSAAQAEGYGISPRPSRARKADIFSQRVLFPPLEVSRADSAKDSLLHSLNIYGRVNLDFMEEIYGRSREQIIGELEGLLFNDPVEGLVTHDVYLSGDVKTKLDEARKAAEGNPEYLKNVMALEGVIPKDKLPSEIFVSIGGNWVPVDIYSTFAKEISGADVDFSYVNATGQWLMANHGGGDFSRNNGEYGTDRMGALDILFHAMNSRGLEVKKKALVDGVEKYVTDESATEAVRQKGDKIRGLWDSWLWNDGERADRLMHLYNEKFNRMVERKNDGSHLTFPGMNPAIQLLSHQKNGVWRGLQDRVLLADQVVGAGKTFELAALAMEMRRLGIAKKPMFVVPNHLTLQWRSEFYRLYPGANVLAATPQDFDKEHRERLFSKIVTGNWDAVVVGHSSLKKIAVPLEAEKKILKEQFDEISRGIEKMKDQRGDRNIIRDMEKIKENLKAKMDRLNDKAGKKDNVVDFADLGVDALIVDEFHVFKNLFFTTQMNRVAGLGNPAGSGQAFDMFVKIRWMQDTFGEKAPLVTATGTPVSNSLSEMFTMQRYMQYSRLKDLDLHLFDAWAKQYGDVQTVYEVAPSGTGYRLSQRFAKFKNLPSLMGEYRSFADVITLDDLKEQEIAKGKTFPVPKVAGGRPLNVVARRSELQEKFFGVPKIVKDEVGRIRFEIDLSQPFSIEEDKPGQWLLKTAFSSRHFDTREDVEYALALGSITPLMTIDPKSIIGQFENLRELTRKTKGKINALSLTGLANKAGLDYRIVDPAAQDFPDSKINQSIGNMLSLYRAWEKDKGTQLVFCDLSVPLSAKAKMASHEKRIFVRDEEGRVVHKKGTLHVPKGHEGFPYYLVSVGKGTDRTVSVFDPMTGQLLKDGLDGKAAAHELVKVTLGREGGYERWWDMREKSPVIEDEEIEEYKHHHSMLDDGDVGDSEISIQDVEGATGAFGFSVYDDIKSKLVAAGIPANEVEFIHDHDTPQAKDALFKRVNSGDVRFLLGSTPKMGAGTNVQERLVGLHHIDAPWRPSDLEQREGRIIRRGNLLYERDPEKFEVSIFRYATSQTYDTRRWQLLEHKAAGVQQLRNYSGENEIEDVVSEASNSADMKAAASGNPLILKETQLSTEVKKLVALEKAHRDGEFVVRHRMQNRLQYAESYGPSILGDLKTLLLEREEAGQAGVLGVYEGRKLLDKEAVTFATTHIAKEMVGIDNRKMMVYRGVPFEFESSSFYGIEMKTADGDRVSLGQFSPSGVVTRMENFVNSLEKKVGAVEEKIEGARQEGEKLAQMIGRPFEKLVELEAARDELGQVQRALMKANAVAAVKDEEKPVFDAAVRGQKEKLRELGFSRAVEELEVGGNEGVVGEIMERMVEGEKVAAPENVKIVAKGIHIGRVLNIDEGVVVQDGGKGILIGHLESALDRKVDKGAMLEVVYSGGRGLVTSRSDVTNPLPRMRGDGA